MSSIETGIAFTRRTARSGVYLRRRWRRVDRWLTGGIGAMAVTAAVYLGVTAPTSSPVQAPLPAAAATAPEGAAQQDPTAQDGGGFGARQFDQQRFGGPRADGGRGFGGGR